VSGPALTREARKAQTREAIIEAARELFAAQGIEATSLDRIAREVGLTKGAVYSTFANKDELVEAVALASAVNIDVDVLFRPEVPLKEGLRSLGSAVWAARKKLAHDLIKLDLELFLYEQRHQSWGRRVLAEQRSEVAGAAEKLEAIVVERGEKLPCPGIELINALQALARGVVQELERDPKALSQETVLMMFEGLAGG
jgi:AcrR family transcriptional regulator